MFADAVLAVVLQIESHPGIMNGECMSGLLHTSSTLVYFLVLCYNCEGELHMLVICPLLEIPKESKKKEPCFPERLLKLMREMFGSHNANWSGEEGNKIEITVDSNTALLDSNTLVSSLLLRVVLALVFVGRMNTLSILICLKRVLFMS